MNNKIMLLVDIGNSQLKWMLIKTPVDICQKSQFNYLGYNTHPHHQYAQLMQEIIAFDHTPSCVWASNVAAPANKQNLEQALHMTWPHLPIHWINAAVPYSGIHNHYDQKSSLGSDRWAAVIGAQKIFPQQNLLIVTAGTATTLNILTAQGDFLGGLIAPGLHLMLNSLLDTTQIKTVTQVQSIDPDILIFNAQACTTEQAIINGCLTAQTSLIQQTYQQLAQQLPNLYCILTGGAVPWLTKTLSLSYYQEPHLVLRGLIAIAHDHEC